MTIISRHQEALVQGPPVSETSFRSKLALNILLIDGASIGAGRWSGTIPICCRSPHSPTSLLCRNRNGNTTAFSPMPRWARTITAGAPKWKHDGVPAYTYDRDHMRFESTIFSPLRLISPERSSAIKRLVCKADFGGEAAARSPGSRRTVRYRARASRRAELPRAVRRAQFP